MHKCVWGWMGGWGVCVCVGVAPIVLRVYAQGIYCYLWFRDKESDAQRYKKSTK